jgi:uncharacterized phage-associated protein
MESAFSVANYFIKKSLEDKTEMTPMKLIKLVYIANGWYLALTKHPLFPERIEAWKYGPVIPSIYHAFKYYYNNQITNLYTDVFDDTPMPEDSDVISFLNKIWDVYGRYDGLQLSSLTHQKNTPWDIAWNGGGNKKNSVSIDNEIIKKHYMEKMNSPQTMLHVGT